MGWDFIPPLAYIHPDNSFSVDWKTLVGVNNHTEQARIGVDHLGLEAHFQVVEDRCVI
jgi:hypothetical protein